MVSVRSVVGAFGAASGAVLMSMVLMPAAQAASPPSQGTFTNSAGQTNGCTGSLAFWTVQNAETDFGYTGSFTCPGSAGIHYGQYYDSLHVVNADGTWTTVHPQDVTTWAEKNEPAVQGTGASGIWPCASPGQPTHTYVARYVIQLRSVKGQDPFQLSTQAKYTC